MPKAPNLERRRMIVTRYHGGETPRQIADDLGVTPSGIHNLLVEMGAKAALVRRPVAPAATEPTARRVHRDPCPRCGVRADFGCEHSPAPLSMGAFV